MTARDMAPLSGPTFSGDGTRRVLDVGSASRVHPFGARDGAVVALDISHAELARLPARRRDGRRVLPLQADAARLPFAGETFDEIGLFEVLEHVEEPATVLSECWRALRPGGVLTMSVPTAYSERVYWRLHPHYESQSTHLRIFERDEVAGLLTTTGFNVELCETRHFVPMLAWFVHCLLRTPADHTGAVLAHRWVDDSVARGVGLLRRMPLLATAVRFLSTRYGKSWRFTCAKVPAL